MYAKNIRLYPHTVISLYYVLIDLLIVLLPYHTYSYSTFPIRLSRWRDPLSCRQQVYPRQLALWRQRRLFGRPRRGCVWRMRGGWIHVSWLHVYCARMGVWWDQWLSRELWWSLLLWVLFLLLSNIEIRNQLIKNM